MKAAKIDLRENSDRDLRLNVYNNETLRSIRLGDLSTLKSECKKIYIFNSAQWKNLLGWIRNERVVVSVVHGGRESLWITIGTTCYYLDNSTGEHIVERWEQAGTSASTDGCEGPTFRANWEEVETTEKETE